ncbi:hypothetical protein QIW53_09580 [Pseudomonas fluorescens]|uniref:hypothetical protein n=1 Tax=Pseudomonas fluorescens TaxID=294 RepID=UPI00352506E1
MFLQASPSIANDSIAVSALPSSARLHTPPTVYDHSPRPKLQQRRPDEVRSGCMRALDAEEYPGDMPTR